MKQISKSAKIFRFIPLLLLFLSFPRIVLAAENQRSQPIKSLFEENKEVEAVGDSLEYQKDEKKIIAKGNVIITHEDQKITADYAEIGTDDKKAYARGHVILFERDIPSAYGNEIYYDFSKHSGSFPNGRFIEDVWYSTGEDIQQLSKDRVVVHKGKITTCDREKPHYEIHAKKVTIHSRDKMVAQNVTLYILGKPVFWWPYFVIPLRRGHLPLTVIAGHSTEDGYFIKTAKGFSINQQIGGDILVDWRSRRGVGGGANLGYDYGNWGQGEVKGYLTQDERAPTTGIENPYSQREDRVRGRFTWAHRTNFDDYTNIIARYNRFADEFFLHDFFERESHGEIEPQSFVTFTKNSERSGFLIHNEKKVNDFESMVERLPEVRFDWKDQPFFNPNLFYESRSSFDNMVKTFKRSDSNEAVVRTDSNHQWFVPLKWNEVKFTPQANLRGTGYSREKESDDGHFRTIMGLGTDVRTQYYKTYPAFFDKMGIEINHLRHVVEPSFQYRYTTSTVSDETLGHFDQIDRLDDSGIVTLGLENRLQTKRIVNGRTRRVDFVSLNTFLSYEIHPDGRSIASTNFAEFEEAGRTKSNFTILSEELVLRPYEWLQYETRGDFDVEKGALRVLNQDLLARTRRFKLLFGHRFINDFLASRGSNQFVFDGRWTLNPLWEFGGYIRWDIDRQDLQEWQISARRDLHDFMLEFGYNVRNSAIHSSNRELFFSFGLKAFPILGIHKGPGRASFSEPRIGETVAGASQSEGGYAIPQFGS